MTGVQLIAAERKRQIKKEGFTETNDDFFTRGELARAGSAYACPADMERFETVMRYTLWPWDGILFKETPDNRIRELVKAGALIAAEIDRLQRRESEKNK
jgi:hypothetical protein